MPYSCAVRWFDRLRVLLAWLLALLVLGVVGFLVLGHAPLFVMWGILLIAGWLPLVVLLAGFAQDRWLVLLLPGFLWAIVMLDFAKRLSKLAGIASNQTTGGFAENLLIGGGAGVLGGIVWALVRHRSGERRNGLLIAGVVASGLFVISLYPAIQLFGVVPALANAWYVVSGEAASDAVEAAQPVLPLDQQLDLALPAMAGKYAGWQIVDIVAPVNTHADTRTGIGSPIDGMPKRWCLVLWDGAHHLDGTHDVYNGRFDAGGLPDPRSVGCAFAAYQPAVLTIGQDPAWPWVTPAVAAQHAAIALAQALPQFNPTTVVELEIRSDTDGAMKWLIDYQGVNARSQIQVIAMVNARSGEVLCVEQSRGPDSTCHWGRVN